MGLLEQLQAELETLSPEERAAFAARVSPETHQEPGPPPKPPTILDDIRDAGIDALDALGLSHTQLPSINEIPVVLGQLVEAYHDLKDRVTAVENGLGEGASKAAAPGSPPSPPDAPTPDEQTVPPQLAGIPAEGQPVPPGQQPVADQAGTVHDNPTGPAGTGFPSV